MQAQPLTPAGAAGTARVLALLLGAACIVYAARFPVAANWLPIGLLGYVLLLLRYPNAWLIVVPALLPVLDLTPWSGRNLLGAYDLLVMVTIAGGWWHGAYRHWVGSGESQLVTGLLAILAVIEIGATLYGLRPYPAPTADDLVSYTSPYNSLRLAKGFLLALLLLPLLQQAWRRQVPVERLFTLGMLAGGIAAAASIAWERALFTGLFNLDTPYRTTGLFFGMHNGGAALDAYLVLTVPFAYAWLAAPRAGWRRWTAVAWLAVMLYCLLVSFSRANYLAVLVMVPIVIAAAWLQAGPGHRRAWTAAGLLLAGAGLLAAFGSDYAAARFKDLSGDMQARLDHYRHAVQLVGTEPLQRLFGTGKGRYPALYRQHQATRGGAPPSAELRSVDHDNYLQFAPGPGRGPSLELRQRFVPEGPGPYTLQLRARQPAAARQTLLVEFCRRNLLLPNMECPWAALPVRHASGDWQDYTTTVVLELDARAPWYRRAPHEISVLNRGLPGGLDIDWLQLYAPSGRPLLSNPGLERGLDNWYLADADHLAWHVKNIWVDLYVEGGVLKLLVFSLFIFALFGRLTGRVLAGDATAVALLAALAGVLAIGLFDSVLDVPRIALLFYLLCWMALHARAGEPAPATGDGATTDTQHL